MCATEDTKQPWLAGSNTSSPSREDDVYRIQTGGTECPADPSLDNRNASKNGVHGSTSEHSSGISSILDSFAAKEWKPHKYQERGIRWLLQPAAALFLPPGLGKSSILLAAICKLKAAGIPHRTLLLAPLMVCRTTWMTEPTKWRQFQDLKVGFAHGPDKELILNDPYYDIVLVNYDGIAWFVPILLKGNSFDILACDEITRLKNTASKRYKLIKPLLPSFTFRWGLTGTPASNGLMDLFGQVYTLDLGQRLGKFITHFRLKYFHQKPHDEYRYFITPEKQQALVSKIADLAMYVDPEEWLDLPEFLVIIREVTMREESVTKYKELEKEFILLFEAGAVTAANAGVLTNKLRQYTGGALYINNPEYQEVDSAKLDNLDLLIEEMAGEPLMVAYQFDHEAERILKRHPEARALRGGMSAGKVQEIVDHWNSGTLEVLLVQPATAALGLNLQFGGSAICWFTLTYNLEEYIQLNKRLHRQGQVDKVRCYLIAATKTIDQRVAQVLSAKDIVQEDVFLALKLKL
jgi:SNF2 family DNA or RNA helicase